MRLATLLLTTGLLYAPIVVANTVPTKVALCIACHGTDGYSTIPGYPHLAGQWAVYTAKALRDYRNKKRPNVVMQGIAATLTDEDIEQLAAYYETIED